MSSQDSDADSSDVACPTCGRTNFADKRGMRTHHAAIHGESLVSVEVECANCGVSVTKHREDVKKTERSFCSDACQNEWQTEAFGGQKNPNYKGAVLEYECTWCGKSCKTFDKRDYSRRFCSTACHGAWRSENQRGENHHQWTSRVEIICEFCEVIFEVKPNRAETSRFCSQRCLYEWQSRVWSGDGNHNWKGGLFPYGSGWNETKKEAVRERDEYECQGCGMEQTEHLDRFGRKLHVHHKQKARAFDDPEERNSMANLVSLCQGGCHQTAERMSPLYPFAD